ncbi:MAG: hypothetical protein K6T92_01065, partial [Candidatus Rokubacteria bacterium]|nr:hypothetical protein [Candidatus Rokubacteria bacterium]
MRRPSALVALVLALGLVALSPAADAQQKVTLVFSSGPTGGSWIPMAGAVSEVVKKRFPELDVQVEPGAALVNMEKIRNDKADLDGVPAELLGPVQAALSWRPADRPTAVELVEMLVSDPRARTAGDAARAVAMALTP